MTKETAKLIEEKYNVYVDVESGLYNYNGYGETYGWLPIPKAWINTV